jgi:uncharacterized membrane protein YfhO
MNLDALRQGFSTASAFEDAIAERRAAGLTLTSFSQTRIKGTIAPREKSILVFQTPFDPGWRAEVDEKPVPVLRVNAGLLGLKLDSGEHRIGLRYRPPFFYAGAAVTLFSCCIISFGLWRWPRLDLPD